MFQTAAYSAPTLPVPESARMKNNDDFLLEEPAGYDAVAEPFPGGLSPRICPRTGRTGRRYEPIAIREPVPLRIEHPPSPARADSKPFLGTSIPGIPELILRY